MNFLVFLPLLSIMMVVHELGHYITARLSGITVEEFGLGLPPRLWGFKRKGVIYSINWIPFGAFVKMLGEEDPNLPGSFASKPRLTRAIVLMAGSAMNFLLAVFAFALAFMVGVPTPTDTGPVKLVTISQDSPAAQAGLQAGDVVESFDGQSLSGTPEFQQLTQQSLGQPVTLVVNRGGQDVQVTLTPRQSPPPNQGAIGVVISGNTVITHAPPWTALKDGGEQAASAVGVTLSIPTMLLNGSVTPQEARPIGLPGMAELTAQAVTYATDTGFWYPLFILTGLFSAGLSVTNMLPIPALDGGRLLFVIIEWIRGRRIPPEREATYHLVGIVLLLALMVVISVNDLQSGVPTVNWGGP